MMVGRAVWAIVSAALAFGINLQLKTTFTRSYDRAQYEDRTGQLLAKVGPKAVPVEIALANVHIVTTDFAHFGKRYEIRELSLRAAEDILATPRIEIYCALPEQAHGQDPSAAAHNPLLLRNMDLPIEPEGFLKSKPSFFMVTKDQRAAVVAGSVRFNDIVALPEDIAYLATGTLHMQIETDDGIQSVVATVQARMIWDAD